MSNIDRKNLRLVGKHSILRLATAHDAKFMYNIRTNPRLTKYLSPLSNFGAHEAWLKNNLDNETQFNFIVEDLLGKPAGIVSVHDIDFHTMTCSAGRWIMSPDFNYGTEPPCLLFDFVFETLSLQKIVTEVFLENKKVVGFHNLCGFSRELIYADLWEVRGVKFQVAKFSLSKDKWAEVRQNMKSLSVY